MTTLKHQTIGIVGSCNNSRMFAVLFASAGYDVYLYNSDKTQLQPALENVRVQLQTLHDTGFRRGTLTVDQQCALIKGTDSLSTCVKGAKYVQEMAPETTEAKSKIFAELDAVVDDKTIMGSSTFIKPVSQIVSGLTHRSQVIGAHHVDPMFYSTLVEVMPAPFTAQWVKDATIALFKEIGQAPVLIKKEVFGYIRNRLNFSIVSECWRLIANDVMSVEDLDSVVTNGLGMRYAFMGPLSTCHLNAEGIVNYSELYGDMLHDVVSDFGPPPRMDRPTAEKIQAELVQRIPVEKVSEWRAWRMSRLADLVKLRKDNNGPATPPK